MANNCDYEEVDNSFSNKFSSQPQKPTQFLIEYKQYEISLGYIKDFSLEIKHPENYVYAILPDKKALSVFHIDELETQASGEKLIPEGYLPISQITTQNEDGVNIATIQLEEQPIAALTSRITSGVIRTEVDEMETEEVEEDLYSSLSDFWRYVDQEC